MFEELFKTIQDIYGKEGTIPLHAPVLDESDKQSVLRAINSGFVSSVGKEVTEFEEKLANYTGSLKAVAVMNGTAALHLGLVLSGVKTGDLVITQALTFVATANAISYTGAEPVFLDSDFDTMGLSADALESFLRENAIFKTGYTVHKGTGKIIRACVPMHVFGHPVRINEIISICRDWNIRVVEDAAEALGSKVNGKQAGTFGEIGVLSFNGNKIITTGGGGALLFQNEKLAARAKHLSTTAKVPHAWSFNHDEIGFNYRMPNLNAALGCAQIDRLAEFLIKKKMVAQKYKDTLLSNENIFFIGSRKDTEPNFWLNTILVKNKAMRDLFLAESNTRGIGCRPVWELMTDLDIYSHCIKDDLKAAKELRDRIINLPSGVPS